MNKLHFIVTSSVMLRILLFASCLTLIFPLSPLFAEETTLLRIALLTELSGSNALNGQSCREGFDLAREVYGKLPQKYDVQYIYADSKGLPAAGVSEMQRLTTIENIDALVATRSQVGMALNPISNQRKLPLLGIVGHARFISENPYAFRFWPTTSKEGPELAKKALALKKKRMAIITLEDEWTTSLTDAFKKAYAELGGEIVLDESIQETDSDFPTLVSKIRSSQPDAIFINLSLAQSGALIRKIRENKLSQQLFSNFWGANQATIDAAGNDSIEGLIYAAVDLDQPSFKKQFESKYRHKNINAVTYSCYAALSTLYFALTGSNSTISSKQQLYDALLNTAEVRLVDGPLRLTDREADFTLTFQTIKNGVKVPAA